jgi:hypothetical protein
MIPVLVADLVLTVYATVLLTACSGGGGSAAPSTAALYACRDAMAQQFEQDALTGATGSRPPQCAGVADHELALFAGQLMSGDYAFGDGKAVALP